MNPAEYVMNCPDLRNLILSQRSEIMRPYERPYIKRKMAPTLRAIENMVDTNTIDDYDCTTHILSPDLWRCYKCISNADGHQYCKIVYYDLGRNIDYSTGYLY